MNDFLKESDLGSVIVGLRPHGSNPRHGSCCLSYAVCRVMHDLFSRIEKRIFARAVLRRRVGRDQPSLSMAIHSDHVMLTLINNRGNSNTVVAAMIFSSSFKTLRLAKTDADG